MEKLPLCIHSAKLRARPPAAERHRGAAAGAALGCRGEPGRAAAGLAGREPRRQRHGEPHRPPRAGQRQSKHRAERSGITRPGGGAGGGTRARGERTLQHQHWIRLRLRSDGGTASPPLPALPCPAPPRPAGLRCDRSGGAALPCQGGSERWPLRCGRSGPRGAGVRGALGHAAVAARSAGLCAARPLVSQAMSAAPQGPDLSFLDEEEARAIFQVLQRDAELRRAEKDRVRYRLSAPFCWCHRGGGGHGMGLWRARDGIAEGTGWD